MELVYKDKSEDKKIHYWNVSEYPIEKYRYSCEKVKKIHETVKLHKIFKICCYFSTIYKQIIDCIIRIFGTTRNGVFFGVPYVGLGCIIAYKYKIRKEHGLL